MTRIAVLGLGAMGARMAARLLQAGHVVFVYNRTAAAAEALAGQGGRPAASPRDAAAGAGCLMSSSGKSTGATDAADAVGGGGKVAGRDDGAPLRHTGRRSALTKAGRNTARTHPRP